MGKIINFPGAVKRPSEDDFSELDAPSNTEADIIMLSEDPIQLLKTCRGLESREQRARIMDALKASPDYKERLLGALKSGAEDTEFRASLVNILMFHEGQDVRSVLYRLVRDKKESYWVRSTAYRALEKHGGYKALLDKMEWDKDDGIEDLCRLKSSS